ncbi:MAG: PorV/PorQ family protein [Ignavibacteriaceae bacterium]|nr:PorV/PorQ family protein [Ignavibacteriaceae bacterium]
MKKILDINLFSLAYSTEFENIGRFGTAIKYINYGSFDEADEFGNRTGEFSAGELAFILGYTNEFSENFYYGANAKVIYSSIADESSSALALDFGINYEIPNQKLNLAAAVLNLGTQLSSYIDTKEDLPLDVTVGISKRLENLPVRLVQSFISAKFLLFDLDMITKLVRILRLVHHPELPGLMVGWVLKFQNMFSTMDILRSVLLERCTGLD